MSDGNGLFHILNIQFYDIESIEPAVFDPNVRTYHIRRTRASPCSLAFSVTGNTLSDDIYRKYQFICDFTSNPYRAENWVPNKPEAPCCRTLNLPNSHQTVTISFGPQRPYEDNFPWVTYTYEVDRIELTAEEAASCTHSSTYNCEGEVWGGASGSCQVEILHTCSFCSKVLSRTIDYRD